MGITRLDHYAVRTLKLAETKDFYVDLLGLEDGARPAFPFPGHWLYIGETPVVHLVGIDPQDPSGLEDYLGPVEVSSLDGSGSVDHLAFRAEQPEALIKRLKKAGQPYRERQVPDMDLYQIFVDDPNGIPVELNYFGLSVASA